MSKPASCASREESLLLLNAYLDNELDAAAVLEVERRLASDATLRAEHENLVELRSALATHLKKDRASDTLRRRAAAIAAKRETKTSSISSKLSGRLSSRTYDWRQMMAAAFVGATVALGAAYLGSTGAPSSRSGEIGAIVAGHQRGLLAGTPFDVASSDRHTVKPWFDSKLALSPQVVDLTGAGFPLAGGRIDLIGGRAVPTMVYRRREHLISVVAIPDPGGKESSAAPTVETRDGYFVVRWEGRDFRYAAVSDVAENELEDFVTRWREEASAKSP